MKDQTAMPSSGAPHRKRYRHAATVPEVQSITNAAEAHSQEMHGRVVKYATAMSIRMVCIGLIFVVDGWFKLVPMVGAVVLPWIAVVIANGGADTNQQGTDALLDEVPRYQLAEPHVEDDGDFPVVLDGELVDDERDDVGGRSQDNARDGGTGTTPEGKPQ